MSNEKIETVVYSSIFLPRDTALSIKKLMSILECLRPLILKNQITRDLLVPYVLALRNFDKDQLETLINESTKTTGPRSLTFSK